MLALQKKTQEIQKVQEIRTNNKPTIDALDGIRAFACLSVISYHLNYFTHRIFDLTPILGQLGNSIVLSGYSGVTLFFVLSGFLLFMPYAKYLLFDQPRPSTRTFYWRRFLRIIPSYYLALVLITTILNPDYLRPNHFWRLLLFPLFLMDSPATYQQINGPFWTLAIEWQYYLLLPLFVLAFSLFVRRGTSPQLRLKRITICLIGMIVWGITTRGIGIFYTMLHPNWTLLVPRPVLNIFLLITYGTSGKYFEDFAIGMLCSTLYIYTRNAAPNHRLTQYISKRGMRFWGTGIGILLFMACWKIFYYELFFLDPFIGDHMLLTEFGYASGYGLCIIGVLFGPVGLRTMLSWQPLRWIGSLSYGMYLWHLPFLHLVDDYIVKRYSTDFLSTYALYWGCVLLITIPLAYLLYRFYERPCTQLAHTQPKKQKVVKEQVIEERRMRAS